VTNETPDSLITSLRKATLGNPLAERLLVILSHSTGVSSSGFPFMERQAWEQFRDGIPHILGMGHATLSANAQIQTALGDDKSEEAENIRRACKVVEQIVFTATVTAPPSLWLARHLLGSYCELGLLARLLKGQAIYPEDCRAEDGASLSARELNTDLLFFLSLGLVEQYDGSYRIAGHPRARRILEAVLPVPLAEDPAKIWKRLFGGEQLTGEEKEVLLQLGFSVSPRESIEQNHWLPTLAEIELGYRLVPVVLGLRAAERSLGGSRGDELRGADLSEVSPLCGASALEILTAAGWCEREGEGYRVTRIGERGLARAPGPFGIIHTYHPYMTQAKEILRSDKAEVWVERGDNVAASQDANKGTFQRGNASLDAFLADTGFKLSVFIEHAIGKGEATQQRWAISGEEGMQYVGADLEDPAIDAAQAEQAAGRLPANMIFVRRADIGEPQLLLAALKEAKVQSRGAVMMVGNGFHEIRNQSDESMKQVFQGYADAGIILLFTEENALAIDDIRQTAWNTYHAAFKYVHEKSGQGLRPAEPRGNVRLGEGLRAAWSECAVSGGYRRIAAYCGRTRTIYPYPPRNGINPSISVNHFLVPEGMADEMGLVE
jgi:hypothetical protein